MDEFATYPSLQGKVVYISGGTTGIGAQVVEHFAAQGARVGFIGRNEAAAAAGHRRLCEERLAGAHVPARRRDRHRRPARLDRGDGGRPRPDQRARQQRRQRSAAHDGRGHARILGRAHARQPAAPVLRHPGGRGGHARGRRRLDHQPRLDLVDAEGARHAGLHDRQGGDPGPDANHSSIPRPRQHPGPTRWCRVGSSPSASSTTG